MPALSLTDEEVRHLRAATRNAARAYGGVAVLARVMGVTVETVYNLTAPSGSRPPGGSCPGEHSIRNAITAQARVDPFAPDAPVLLEVILSRKGTMR